MERLPDAEPRDADGVLTVGELNWRIKQAVASTDDLQDVTCHGEVIDVHESAVACYFGLTDGEHTVQCVLWQNRYDDMDLELEDGLEVLLAGDVDYWEEGGTLNVKPWLVHPVGEGDQHAALEKLRLELADRGWFAEEVKRDLPAFPACVGLVTSRNGDARYDVQQAIHDRYPDVDVLVRHASVQGDAAPVELADGIATLDARDDVDAIIVGRGGGSDAHLMAFNTEMVAEAIYHATTPVVTAVGHRTDETIADAVADAAAITPTAAGELVVRDKRDELADVEAYRSDITTAYRSLVRDRLETYDRRLETAYEDAATARLRGLADDLETAYTDAIRRIEHETEKKAAVEQARTEATAVPLAYRAAVVVLAVLLVALLIWILL